MTLHDEDILRIIREAPEPVFPSDVTAKLNEDSNAGTTVDAVATRLTKIKDVIQLPDGRWTLKRRA
jgi:hypothetical protein